MRTLGVALGFGLTLAGGFAACKLDLDESLMGGSDAAIDASYDGLGGDAPGLGGSDGGGKGGKGGSGGSGGKEAGPACDANAQCSTDAGCLEGRCSAGACIYELCPAPSACEGRTCDTAANACTAATPIGFKANTIELASDIGCGGSAARCVAGVGDYVFTALDDGTLHAWRLTNPAAPEKLTIDSPTFTVNWLIAARDRLLILSPIAAGKLQLAWVDLPSDPLTTKLDLTQVGVNFTSPLSAAYPGAATGFFLVENDSTALYPAAYLEPPVVNNSTVTKFPSTGLVPSAAIVAASGKSLVSFRVNASSTPVVPTFTLVAQAGTASAQNGAEKALGFESPTDLGAHAFSSGFDGSVLWTTNRVFRDDAGAGRTTEVVVRWLLAGGSTTLDGAPEASIATYSEADWNVARRGPSAIIDANTALVTVAYPVDSSQTLVKPVSKAGNTLTVGAASTVLSFKATDIGVTATRKYGVVLTPSITTAAVKPRLHVFAPACG